MSELLKFTGNGHLPVSEWRLLFAHDELCPHCAGWCFIGDTRCPVCAGRGLKDLRVLAKERGCGVLLFDGRPIGLIKSWERI